MSTNRRCTGVFCCFLLFTTLVGCNGASPTQPTFDDPGPGPALFGEAVISGVATGGGGGFNAEGFAAPAVNVANLQVSVEGTSVRTITDANGNFRLVNVPPGDARIRFAGQEVDAMLMVPAVGKTQQIELQVQVQSSSANIVTDNRAQLDRFQGLATSVVLVGTSGGTITLDDGTIVDVDNVTWWDTGGDYFNLLDLQAAVNAGLPVDITGQGTLNTVSGRILASVVRAELTGSKFEGIVASATGTDPNGTILLVANTEGGPTDIRVDAATVWDPSGDVVNLTELIAALGVPFVATAKGQGTLDPSGTFILAGDIEVTLERAEFEGVVASASGTDPVGTILLTVNLKNSIIDIRTDIGTVWQSGAITSLTALLNALAALAAGETVEVEGEGFVDAARTFILARSIKAKIDSGVPGGGGCAVGQSFATEIAMIQSLITDVQTIAQASGLNKGQTNALVSKLDNAIKDLGKCNSNPAGNKLGAFINQVNAFVNSNKLTATDGATLTSAAQAIIAALNGS